MAPHAQAVLAPESKQNGHAKGSMISQVSKYRPEPTWNPPVAPLATDKKTDKTRWRLKDDHGRQTWHYLSEEEAKEWPQKFSDKYFLNLPLVSFALFTCAMHR